MPLVADIEALARRARVRLAVTGGDATDDDGPGAGLSPRELEVLALVAAGHTNREIAAQLYISDKTASVHVSHILASSASQIAGRRRPRRTASASCPDRRPPDPPAAATRHCGRGAAPAGPVGPTGDERWRASS